MVQLRNVHVMVDGNLKPHELSDIVYVWQHTGLDVAFALRKLHVLDLGILMVCC